MPGPGRNELCPRGSGRKVKRCCGQRRGPGDGVLLGDDDRSPHRLARTDASATSRSGWVDRVPTERRHLLSSRSRAPESPARRRVLLGESTRARNSC